MTSSVAAPDEATWAGQPAGLSTLYFTEMWERFSFYGMRALLILYLTAAVADGGAGLSVARAAAIYGWYMFGVYAAAIPGGWLADRVLGPVRSVLVGGVLIAAGHYALALAGARLRPFGAGLLLIVLGTGLLKPNISALVGGLYAPGDPRRDAGFSIFYMGINLGAFLAPFVCGTLGQRVGWHWGFGAAGVGMTLGLVQYAAGRRRLAPAEVRSRGASVAIEREPAAAPAGPLEPARGAGAPDPPAGRTALTRVEWRRMAAIGVFFVAAMIFWAAFEQAGSSLNLFADRATDRRIAGFEFPSTWLQSVNALFIILLAPVFAWLWPRLDRHGAEPSSPLKFALGLAFVGLGFALLVPAALLSRHHPVSPLWLVGAYLLHTIGELCLSPVGLSVVTKLAPRRLVGSMMGVWFLATACGERLGGSVAGLYGTLPLALLFGWVCVATAAAAGVLALLARRVSRLMGGVH
jgi:POT family proton-dependent oligopeptide transporter